MLLSHLRHRLSPALRGSLFYLGYWGIVGVFLPFINVYFARLGLSGSELGVLAAIYPLMNMLVAPAISALADRRRLRTVLLAVALTGLSGVLALMTLGRTFGALVPLMALLALARSPVAPIGDSLVVRMAARHRLNYGRLRLWGSISFAAVAIACGALWQRIGFGPMFPLAAVLFVPVIISALLLDEGQEAASKRERRPLRDIGRDAGLVALLVGSFLIGATLNMGLIFEGIYMDQLGGGELLVGAMFGLSAFAEAPMMLYGERIARRVGPSRALLIAYALFVAAYLGYIVAGNPWMLLLFSLLSGLGFGLYFVATVRTLAERAPEEWAATIQAINTAGAWGLAPLIAGPISGAIFDAWGADAVFAACATAVVLAMVVIVAAMARRAL